MTKQDNTPLDLWDEPPIARFTTQYLKRLLVERHAIHARLENPGGSIIVQATRKAETERQEEYGSVIGSSIHCDLMEAEIVLKSMNPVERKQLLDWVDGLPSRAQAELASIKEGSVKRRGQRIAKKMVERLNTLGPVTITRVK